MMKDSALVLDLGGGTIKLGLSTDSEPSISDNCIYKSKNVSNRQFIGHQVEECKNLSSLYGTFPFKKGYISNWEVQKQILDSVFDSFFESKSFGMTDLNVIVTEPYFNFSSTKETMNEIFFEDYLVSGLVRANRMLQHFFLTHSSLAAFLSTYKYQRGPTQHMSRYSLVIDSGYSFTHILPVVDGRIMKDFSLRLSIGGKILTNRLIEVTSYRQLDVRSETYIMNQCKEDACYISKDFWSDLAVSKSKDPSVNSILCEYVLPDYVDIHRGYLQKPSNDRNDVASSQMQSYRLRLANERFTVPELLFYPSDVGFSEMGIAEAVAYLISEKLPPSVRPGAWANCIITGGNAKFPGFQERL
ncbi:unnamed protein product [Dibothriocephalus latus]|uniref:Actin-related protein 6 n=1 Tax=Dibothriocephalus latus TaxID=60516 RepID=A0A3P7QTX0_DIBLA|nr:unnamed protein product [Dibothriocephalus latus]